MRKGCGQVAMLYFAFQVMVFAYFIANYDRDEFAELVSDVVVKSLGKMGNEEAELEFELDDIQKVGELIDVGLHGPKKDRHRKKTDKEAKQEEPAPKPKPKPRGPARKPEGDFAAFSYKTETGSMFVVPTWEEIPPEYRHSARGLKQ